MPILHLPPSFMPVQVEFPATKPLPKGKKADAETLKRSCDGALHLRPSSTKHVTADELEYLKRSRPDLMRGVTVADDAKPAPKAKETPKPKAKDTAGSKSASSDTKSA